ncbi:MAG: selenium metabolism-associated LysR family transcriptional regulator [Planctomycetota bacterium]
MAQSEPLSIRQLEVFVALIEKGSFTRAAERLDLSQSTVSGHVADLERRLGVRLVERERAGVRPTAAGQALLRPAREVLRAEKSARMAVAELSGLLSGTLLVGGSTIPASYLLPPIVARFHERHSGVALRVVTGDSAEIVRRVRGADVEIGVVGAPPGDGDLQSDRIDTDQLILILPPTHPLARRKTLAVPDLTGQRFVMREEGSGTRAATYQALGRILSRGELASISVICEVGSTEAVKAAVRAGLGLAFISNLAVKDELEGGTLATARLKGFEVEREFHLIARKESLLSPAARAFRAIALGQE